MSSPAEAAAAPAVARPESLTDLFLSFTWLALQFACLGAAFMCAVVERLLPGAQSFAGRDISMAARIA